MGCHIIFDYHVPSDTVRFILYVCTIDMHAAFIDVYAQWVIKSDRTLN